MTELSMMEGDPWLLRCQTTRVAVTGIDKAQCRNQKLAQARAIYWIDHCESGTDAGESVHHNHSMHGHCCLHKTFVLDVTGVRDKLAADDVRSKASQPGFMGRNGERGPINTSVSVDPAEPANLGAIFLGLQLKSTRSELAWVGRLGRCNVLVRVLVDVVNVVGVNGVVQVWELAMPRRQLAPPHVRAMKMQKSVGSL